jgi:hypothetical protein
MDTYTANSSEYSIDLVQYQYFFPIENIGVGLCPLGCHRVQVRVEYNIYHRMKVKGVPSFSRVRSLSRPQIASPAASALL